MRADRLLALMLMLQTRGKQTAQQLAAELQVSRRTILRDIDALSLAGVPIYSEGGHGGGIALDEQYRTTLTGLHTPEIQALFVPSSGTALRDIGLNNAAQQLLLKLLAALPASHRLTVNHIRQRLMIDSSWWWHDDQTPPFWDDLQQAVYEDRMIETTYERFEGDVAKRTLEPFSLVNKSSLWYLLARHNGEFRIYRVSRFHEVHLLDQSFSRPPDFDLSAHWQAHLKEFMESFTHYACVVRIHPAQLTFVKNLLAGRWQYLEQDPSTGWVTVRLMMDSPLMAKMLLFGLGPFGEVIAPPDLAKATLDDAQVLVNHLRGLETREGGSPP